jgi:hypothetical protein
LIWYTYFYDSANGARLSIIILGGIFQAGLVLVPASFYNDVFSPRRNIETSEKSGMGVCISTRRSWSSS